MAEAKYYKPRFKGFSKAESCRLGASATGPSVGGPKGQPMKIQSNARVSLTFFLDERDSRGITKSGYFELTPEAAYEIASSLTKMADAAVSMQREAAEKLARGVSTLPTYDEA